MPGVGGSASVAGGCRLGRTGERYLSKVRRLNTSHSHFANEKETKMRALMNVSS